MPLFQCLSNSDLKVLINGASTVSDGKAFHMFTTLEFGSSIIADRVLEKFILMTPSGWECISKYKY